LFRELGSSNLNCQLKSMLVSRAEGGIEQDGSIEQFEMFRGQSDA